MRIHKTLNTLHIFQFIFLVYFLSACTILKFSNNNAPFLEVLVDLDQVIDDKIQVTMTLNHFVPKTNTFFMPEIVPGTYSDENYGQYLQDFKAFDKKGNLITVEQTDENLWHIPNMHMLHKITYWVRDSFDREALDTTDGLSLTVGTNFEKGDNFYLNLHAVIGYLDQQKNIPYHIEIIYPKKLFAATSLKKINTIINDKIKISYYKANRYFDIIDNPILIQKDSIINFKVDDMNIDLAVFKKSEKIDVLRLKTVLQEMMNAQKKYLGNLKTSDTYTILLFGLPPSKASSVGALEHHKSTMGVFSESFDQETLEGILRDIISHEFFHVVTPLQLHSEYIHNFNYNSPNKMSKHLWLYEGLTEYFANIFLVNQKLITEIEFYDRILNKINRSKNYSDTIAFTKMSENILHHPYKNEYMNVYEKGPLIAMAIDIYLRESSEGTYGILDLVKSLSEKYNPDKPFRDDLFINEITQMTNPIIGDFFRMHVEGNSPIIYLDLLKKVGLNLEKKEVKTSYFIHTNEKQSSYFDYMPEKGFFFGSELPLNSWLLEMGVKTGDIILSVNEKDFNMENINSIIGDSFSWGKGTEVILDVKRNGNKIRLEGITSPPVVLESFLVADPNASDKVKILRDSWLYN